MAKHTCCWILKPSILDIHGEYSEAKYCGKPVAYHMDYDDDGRPYRRYDNFCAEHKEKAEAQIAQSMLEDELEQ